MTKKSKNKKPALHPDTKLGKFARSVKSGIKTVLGGPAYAGYQAVKSLNSKRKDSGMGPLIKYKKGGYVKPKKSSKDSYNQHN
tara:strand:- start:6119 stop:6367 length:249 start_codon:yes stop_codon:yes gene_type:complete